MLVRARASARPSVANRAQSAPLRCKPALQRTRVTARANSKEGGLGDEEMDVAVFRFTLGIPGFEDKFVPRVVGLIGLGLAGLNHLIGAGGGAQTRAEIIVGLLGFVLVVTPEIEDRLREVQPGKGRQKTAENIEGAANGFFLAPSLSDQSKQELAWGSFSLLKNINSCGVAVVKGGNVIMARGAVRASAINKASVESTLQNLSQGLSSLTGNADMRAFQAGETQAVFLPDRGAVSGAQLQGCGVLPDGAESVLLQRVSGSDGFLMVWSERSRALSERELKWSAAIAEKLGPFL